MRGFRRPRAPSSAIVLDGVLAMLAVLLAGFALEGALRLVLFTDVAPTAIAMRLRRADLYAEADRDDYWKLRARWLARAPLDDFHHPLLGTTTPRSAANPLGVAGRPRPLPTQGAGDEVVLFFGDSYLTTPFFGVADRIPQRLETALPGTAVWNFGMWSYGLDQIVLRLEDVLPHFARPRVLVGVLTDDVDRVVLSVREGQKPRFVLEDGGLVLTNVPIQRDQAEYLRTHPPEITSYVLRATRLALGRTALARHVRALRFDARREEKAALARALVERAVARCRRDAVPVAFVIFYTREELAAGGSWQATLLRRVLEGLRVPYLDTAVPLRDAVRSGAATLDELFDPRTRHHTPQANELVVAALVARWPLLWAGAITPPR